MSARRAFQRAQEQLKQAQQSRRDAILKRARVLNNHILNNQASSSATSVATTTNGAVTITAQFSQNWKLAAQAAVFSAGCALEYGTFQKTGSYKQSYGLGWGILAMCCI